MATSPNFGWLEPDNTDLVRNGALAIRTLGNAIDASLVDLKGGTTGQVLSKTSNTDMDFTWVAQDDSNAIQNALLTTTGDTIYASGASTPARLGIGSTGQVLTVAGGVPSWATPAAGGSSFVGARIFAGSNFSLTNNAYTLVNFDSEVFDTDAFHSTSTNTSRFTIPSGKNGKYLVTFTGLIQSMAASTKIVPEIRKNGSNVGLTVTQCSYVEDGQAFITGIFDLVATDYIEVAIYQNQGSARNLYGGTLYNWFTLQYLGA